jgi:hypothetical protein
LDVTVASRTCALAFVVWAGTVEIGAGVIGSLLSCEDHCSSGAPPWFQPWSWGGYEVYPKAAAIGLCGCLISVAFVAAVFARAKRTAIVFLILTLTLMSYPYFAGLTVEGRALLVFGPFLGLFALLFARAAERG